MEIGDIHNSPFEQQYKNREELTFKEGKITVVDATPEALTDETPVLIAPGWSENQHTYRETSRVVYNSGRRVLTVAYARRGGEVLKDQNYPEAELRKAKLILNVLEKKGIEKADVIAHSEGAMNVLIAAMRKPNKFRNIVLDKPAGLIGKDSKRALTGRFVKLLLKEAIERPLLPTDPTSSLKASSRTVRYIAGNPKRALEEMDALTKLDITDMMERLRKQGIMFLIISGVNDPLFPVSRQRTNITKSGKELPIEGSYTVVGGHHELSIHPDKHAALAVDALNGLQRRRARNDSLKIT